MTAVDLRTGPILHAIPVRTTVVRWVLREERCRSNADVVKNSGVSSAWFTLRWRDELPDRLIPTNRSMKRPGPIASLCVNLISRHDRSISSFFFSRTPNWWRELCLLVRWVFLIFYFQPIYILANYESLALCAKE